VPGEDRSTKLLLFHQKFSHSKQHSSCYCIRRIIISMHACAHDDRIYSGFTNQWYIKFSHRHRFKKHVYAHMRGCTMDLQQILTQQSSTVLVPVLVFVSYCLVGRNTTSMHQKRIHMQFTKQYKFSHSAGSFSSVVSYFFLAGIE
jgi:hypothetical protein